MSLKFICDLFSEKESNIIVFGVPIGRNSKKTLFSLREVSDLVEPFDLDKKRNLLENIKIFDVGDLKLKKLDEITEMTEKILNDKKIPLILGGGHLLTLYSLKAFKDVKLIVFDAHADLKNEYEDEIVKDLDFVKGIKFNSKINDATWLKKACEFINPKNILLLGLRSCDEDEFNFIIEKGILYFTPNQINKDREKVKESLKEFTKNSNLYLSLDIDVFDPSIACTVHYPEPNGLFLNEFCELINTIEGKIIGMDVVCLNSGDTNRITEFLAVRAIFEVLGCIYK